MSSELAPIHLQDPWEKEAVVVFQSNDFARDRGSGQEKVLGSTSNCVERWVAGLMLGPAVGTRLCRQRRGEVGHRVGREAGEW